MKFNAFLQSLFAAALLAFLVVQAAFSLQWHISHDEAPLLYEAYLMRAAGYMPYRDLFDFQMPGAYIAYYLLGRLSGFDTFRLRVVDLLILAVLIAVTYQFMKRFGQAPALAAGLLFGLIYLGEGPSMSLQREYLILLCIACAIWVGMMDSQTLKQRLAIGFFFGLAAVIKPHASLGLLPFLIIDITGLIKRPDSSLLKSLSTGIFPASIGFAIPVLSVFTWLALTNSLAPFLDIALNYWGLYAQVNGQMEINTGAARWAFIFNQLWRLGGYGLWLLPASLGVYLNLLPLPSLRGGLQPDEAIPFPQTRLLRANALAMTGMYDKKKHTYLIAGLAFCFALYPAFSGQFFPYHYIPFIYLIVILSALTLKENRAFRYAPIILLIVAAVNIRPSSAFINQMQGKPIITSSNRADEISRFLKANLKEGDTVQPLDWTGGTLLAMLDSRAQIATPYVFDFYFYHHISTPYIQSLRADFMNEISQARPRFIVEVTAIDKPWITGTDASRDFPELRVFINANYIEAVYKDDYVIYERKP